MNFVKIKTLFKHWLILVIIFLVIIYIESWNAGLSLKTLKSISYSSCLNEDSISCKEYQRLIMRYEQARIYLNLWLLILKWASAFMASIIIIIKLLTFYQKRNDK